MPSVVHHLLNTVEDELVKRVELLSNKSTLLKVRIDDNPCIFLRDLLLAVEALILVHLRLAWRGLIEEVVHGSSRPSADAASRSHNWGHASS